MLLKMKHLTCIKHVFIYFFFIHFQIPNSIGKVLKNEGLLLFKIYLFRY
uniref:Uncharacterized protein n=1 Tax=Anguilla anguilla TaxID=7936 RepID=A0A0E9WG74_ANGAN